MANVPAPTDPREKLYQVVSIGETTYTQSFAEDLKVLKDLGFDINGQKPIGFGAYGEVFSGKYGHNAIGLKDSTGNALKNVVVGATFAVKYVDLEAELGPYDLPIEVIRDSYQTEKNIMSFADHPNITPIRMAVNMGQPSTYTNQKTGVQYCLHKRIYLIMDFAEFGPLSEFIKKYSWTVTTPELIKLAQDCFRGLKYLHDSDIAHCDVHLGNVLIFKNETGTARFTAKWTDFGKGYWNPNDHGDPELSTKKQEDCSKFCVILDEIWSGRKLDGEDDHSISICDRFIQMQNVLDRKRDLDYVYSRYSDILDEFETNLLID